MSIKSINKKYGDCADQFKQILRKPNLTFHLNLNLKHEMSEYSAEFRHNFNITIFVSNKLILIRNTNWFCIFKYFFDVWIKYYRRLRHLRRERNPLENSDLMHPVENCSGKIRARPIDSLVREISCVHQLSGACPCRVSAIDISREGKWNERLISYSGRVGVLSANNVPIKRNTPVFAKCRER